MSMRPHTVLAATVVTAATATTAAGCGGIPYVERPAPQLSADLTVRGSTIYVGNVFPLRARAETPTYVYERRVADEADGSMTSTHITRDPAGVVQLAETARHSHAYALAEYTLHANQYGQTGTVRVVGDEVRFTRVNDGHVKTRTERQREPVAVGPTLVGFIARHLPELRADRKVRVRMAVLDRLETIGFELEEVRGNPRETRIRMKPTSFLVSLVVDPVYFSFARADDRLLHLEGRVPPKVRRGNKWRDFDARVHYAYVAAAYR